ncbi:hypothetical protein CAJAP_09380 [Camponotus japonicus]
MALVLLSRSLICCLHRLGLP